jgi:hypothetical protein
LIEFQIGRVIEAQSEDDYDAGEWCALRMAERAEYTESHKDAYRFKSKDVKIDMTYRGLRPPVVFHVA